MESGIVRVGERGRKQDLSSRGKPQMKLIWHNRDCNWQRLMQISLLLHLSLLLSFSPSPSPSSSLSPTLSSLLCWLCHNGLATDYFRLLPRAVYLGVRSAQLCSVWFMCSLPSNALHHHTPSLTVRPRRSLSRAPVALCHIPNVPSLSHCFLPILFITEIVFPL